MLDLPKLLAAIAELERRAFGPFPESQVRQVQAHPPANPVRLEDVLQKSDAEQPLLQWLSWDATFEDAKRAFVAFHRATAWAMADNPDDAQCREALRILREEPNAKSLIRLALGLPPASQP
ncbi:MAG: hypothetical protein H7Z14_06615 [Anaerolineae bacterium]|nr:hypothetical protein [Phycisphaerae bacterium]